MRIAELAPIYERVPPAAYGGTELIVHLLTEELVRRGHDVTLFATGDSRTSARLVSVTASAMRYGVAGPVDHPEHVQLANVQACYRAAEAGTFDLVHNHAGVEGMVLAATSSTPTLTTTHTPFEPVLGPVWEAYPWAHHAVSASSALTFPARGSMPPIHHGIPVSSFPFGERGEGYLLFLGRFSPRKGPGTAIEVARRSGRRLILAGKVDAVDRAYFESTILPHVDGDRIRFVGEADSVTKTWLLAGADAMLFPITWDEPFGIVMIEALACGTPVIAFRQGSVPEILENGTTGYIVDDVDGITDALRFVPLVSRRRCRVVAEERFDVSRMTDRYLAHFEAI
ncbi:MAG TPA: glycosyltransferase family 4 protein, partial [Candidatus Limnocylindrales bacterium]